ncbi:MAG TPA: ferrochelatase [Gemmatimonadales bacterium]|nr:ferrochelatase [Gemmatimonadales bacterium]
MAEPFAVLLMAYGGPDVLADVEPYLLDVRNGRAITPEFLVEVRGRYERIGGRSPILDLTRAQAAGLARALGDGASVYVGMRHWRPFIGDTVERMVADGQRRAVAIVMAPHFSTMSIGAYKKKLDAAVAGRMEVALVERWGDHPAFLDAVATRLEETLAQFPDRTQVAVIFSAHSLPQRILAAGDAYPTELRASAAAVADRLGLASWRFAYQSAGAVAEPWLGPDVEDVIRELAAGGVRAVALCPIGFVCDHVEILYDIDVEYQAVARKLRVRLERTASLNDAPGLIEALRGITRDTARAKGWL